MPFFWCCLAPSSHPTHILELWKFQGQILYFSTVTFSLRSLELLIVVAAFAVRLLGFVSFFPAFSLRSWFFESDSYTRNKTARWELFKHISRSLSGLRAGFANNLALHFALGWEEWSRLTKRLRGFVIGMKLNSLSRATSIGEWAKLDNDIWKLEEA